MNTKSDKKFIQGFEKSVLNTIKEYHLISPKDKVIVAVSGGKDSTAVLSILSRNFKNVEALTIDAAIGNYTKENLENIKNFCKKNNIKLNIISFRKEFGKSLCYIRSVLNSKGIKMKSCAICGVLKRYLLNKYSRELKFDKLATGHNLDDISQSVVMNLFKGNIEMCARLGPISGVIKDKRFVPRIKPLFFVSEKSVEKYSKLMNFPVVYSRCPCSADAFRREFRVELSEEEKKNIVESLIRILPKINNSKKSSKTEIGACRLCGEPSVGEECSACRIIGYLKE